MKVEIELSEQDKREIAELLSMRYISDEDVDKIAREILEKKVSQAFDRLYTRDKLDFTVKHELLRDGICRGAFREAIASAVSDWLDDRAGWVATLIARRASRGKH